MKITDIDGITQQEIHYYVLVVNMTNNRYTVFGIFKNQFKAEQTMKKLQSIVGQRACMAMVATTLSIYSNE